MAPQAMPHSTAAQGRVGRGVRPAGERGQAGVAPLISEMLGVQTASIDYSEDGRRNRVRIGDEVEAASGPASDAGHAVRQLPEDVDVAVVPSGLLDQVEQDPPER